LNQLAGTALDDTELEQAVGLSAVAETTTQAKTATSECRCEAHNSGERIH
jgi:hypothetical protein